MKEKIIINCDDESIEIQPKCIPLADLREKAIQTTLDLLEIENISHIIYIDDKFDIEGQKDEFIGRVKSLKNQQKYIDEGVFKGFNWDGPDEFINKLWEASEQKEILLNEVYKFEKDDESANVIPALELKRYFGEKFVPMTPDQWIQDNYNSLKDLEIGKKVICLFDYEFHSGNRLIEGRNGVQLAHILLEQDKISKKVICGIFSHTFSEEEEDDKRLEYSTQLGINKAQFYTLSKYRYNYDPSIAGFSEGIKNLLLLPYVEDLKAQSVNIFQQCNMQTEKKISEISPKTFNQIIQKSSLKEGVWEINTLFRLYGILSNQENFNMISNSEFRERFNCSIKRIRSIDNADTGYISNAPNQQLFDLRNSELYLNEDIVNKLHLPISNGDIFNIKKQKYILLVQPCNLSIRAKETECGMRSNSYNNAFLIPLLEFSKEQMNHTKQEIISPNNTSKKVLCAYFPDFKIISLDYLDLTVFNENGESFIDMNNSILDKAIIHFPWEKRYKYIYKKLKGIEDKIISYIHLKNLIKPLIEEYNAKIRVITKDFINLNEEEKKDVKLKLDPIKSEKKELENHLKNLEESIYSIDNFDSLKLNQIDNYNPQKRTFLFKIKRVKHYNSPYSDDLLQKFMLYLSRNAFEHDFTN